jgi:preprotein translocase subunit SecA
MLRNRIGFRQRLNALRGDSVDFDLRSFDRPLDAVNALEADVSQCSDAAIAERAHALRDEPDEQALAMVFALVREAARRTIGLRPFDEQVVAGLGLDRGYVVEMQTGEGKTLAAVMPAARRALGGRGVHVLTFNDYLADRDAHWMAPVYRMLGLSVGFVTHDMSRTDRQRAYGCDVTYVTSREAGFDHLRDMLAVDPAHVVHRPFHAAIVDEADSIMIDEARSPLVVAGSAGTSAAPPRVDRLVAGLEPGVHFEIDEYGRDAELTELGFEAVEQALGCGRLQDEHNYDLLTRVNCALHARVLLTRDVDYIVRDGRIEFVDEFTGRSVPDRRWPDGLHAALEAKEGIARNADGRVLGSITLQHFLNGYPSLCGMTGTAQTAAAELRALYGLRVLVVPTHKPVIRVDHPDVVFTHREAKEAAVVRKVAGLHRSGRPVLVGTLTIEESERLARQFEAAGMPCQVLNARHDATEAQVVARAGAVGAITIATNMAGRGTDIRLGGEDEAERDEVVALGGLCVIATNRHESRRVDLQLRGRGGRQGEPGETCSFVSLEDDLMVRYRIHDLIPPHVMPSRQEAPVDHPIVLREVARAQRIVEGQNHEIRKTLWRYASIVDEQRRVLMEWRESILFGRAVPKGWRLAPKDRDELVASTGEQTVDRAERRAMLMHLDRAWSQHLAFVADVREGIHLVSLGGRDPLAHFRAQVINAFVEIEDRIGRAVRQTLQDSAKAGGIQDLDGPDGNQSSATWTYAVNDDPFRDQIGQLLSGPGRTTVAIYSALFAMPLLILWGVVDRLFKRRRGRSSPGI